MFQKKWVLGAVGAGLLVVGMAAGVVIASNLQASAANYATYATTPSTSASNYCQIYLNTVSHQLGKSNSEVTSANQAGIKAALDQMVKDGKITSAQETQIEQKLQNAGNNPCALVGGLLARGHFGAASRLGGALSGARSAAELAVANALEISTSTLQSDLASGQTIAQIASAKKVNISTVNSAYLNAMQTQLNQAVTNKTITQTQANALYSKLQTAVSQGHYPLLEGGHGMKQATSTSTPAQ
jgi:hypothetical protein